MNNKGKSQKKIFPINFYLRIYSPYYIVLTIKLCYNYTVVQSCGIRARQVRNPRGKKRGRNMLKKLRELISIQRSKNPGRLILIVILLLNVVFLFVSAALIKGLSLTGTEEMSFWEAVFYTVTMILDAGCIQFVIADIGSAGVVLVIVCLAVIIIGMILFTGAVIGYLTNYISSFISNAHTGAHKLYLRGHTVILNWNNRASEIVNDLLYCDTKQYVVILVSSDKEAVEREIQERLSDTIRKERLNAKKQRGKKRFKNNVVFIVREGDTFSTAQLNDISIEYAKSIIILGDDIHNTACRYEQETLAEAYNQGNPQSLKALVQVSDFTGTDDSADNQKIVVEVEDDWTYELVQKIIANKQVNGKCNIIPVSVNKILGRLLSQFSIMPELNLAYRDLFSNKGATFYSKRCDETDERKFTSEYLKTHLHSIPVAIMESEGQNYAFYTAESSKDDLRLSDNYSTSFSVKINNNFRFEQKNVIILGHNSKIKDIMEGFNNFREEWNNLKDKDVMNVIIIDDEKHLKKMNNYSNYPYVARAVKADIYDKDLICKTIEDFVDANDGDTSVLILSDDTVVNEQIDANAITNLIYVRDIINRKKLQNPDFDEGRIDIVVEILNPKHYDIVKNYSVKNVVISNRYISKMMTQIGEQDVLFDFYRDILTYDSANATEMESKEIYIKKVSEYFLEIPEKCAASDLIRAIYQASSPNHTIALGYVTPSGQMTLFSGDQREQAVELQANDKLILFSNH